MTVASTQQNSPHTTEPGVAVSLANGFNSPAEYHTTNHADATPQPSVELCPREKDKLKYKQELAREIVQSLLSAPDNALMIAQALRIELCNSDSNLYVAEDMHTADGEAFNGKGTLWACNSRLCPNCVGKLSNRSRKIIRYVMENQKLMVGENWHFVTFTMPNLNLKNLPLPLIAQIMQAAWKRFTALETRENKRKTWFQETIRGGFKNCEFTYTEKSVYHYHIHSLLIARSSALQADEFFNVRSYWTKALRYAFGKFGIALEINTADGLAVVNVEKVDDSNREEAIRETAKYVTKNDSWSNVPIDQLEEIVAVPRFWRMFESFGACKETAQQIRPNPVKTALNAEKTVTDETVNQSENLYTDTYLDTKDITNRQPNAADDSDAPTKQKRVSWRVRALELAFDEYRAELANNVRLVQAYRRRQLQERYACAAFETLAGERFGVYEVEISPVIANAADDADGATPTQTTTPTTRKLSAYESLLASSHFHGWTNASLF